MSNEKEPNLSKTKGTTPENDTMADQPVKSADETAVGEHTSFTAMVGKLEDKGESEHEAKAVAAKIGDEKYGKDRMEKAAAEHKPVTQVHEDTLMRHAWQRWHLQNIIR
jgi:hypothetical protein